MYKACSRCGKIHPAGFKCPRHWERKEDNEKKLRSRYAWKKKSLGIRADAQWLCEVCREEGRYTYDNLEVHHIEKLRERSDLLLDDDNLICLCQFHHKQADSGEISKDYLRELVKKRQERDEQGEN